MVRAQLEKESVSLPTHDEGVQRSLGPEAGLDDISAVEGGSGGHRGGGAGDPLLSKR